MGINDIRRDSPEYVKRMMHGESILRVGPIWYGINKNVTVANIYYVSNKKVNLIPTLRTEVAMSFASTIPPVDTVQVELVVNYSAFHSNVQKLFALAQVMPVVPINNAIISTITQPIEHNRNIYVNYGYDMAEDVDVHALTEPSPQDTQKEQARKRNMYSYIKEMYCTVPVQMKIDNIRMESIHGVPRDVRILLRLTRVLTSSSYGDRVEYLTNMESVVMQSKFLSEIGNEEGTLPQMQAITDILGIDTSAISEVITGLQDVHDTTVKEHLTDYTVARVLSGDHFQVVKEGSSKTIDINICGIEAPLYNKHIDNRQYSQPHGKQAFDRLKGILKVGMSVKLKHMGRQEDAPKSVDHRKCHVYIRERTDVDTYEEFNIAIYLLEDGLAFVKKRDLDDNTYRLYSNAAYRAKTSDPRRGVWKSMFPETPSVFIQRIKEGRKQ